MLHIYRENYSLYIPRWWFQICFYFHPCLGKCSNLTSYFSDGWFNHQLDIYNLVSVTNKAFCASFHLPNSLSRSYPSVPLPTSPASLALSCWWFRNLCKPIDMQNHVIIIIYNYIVISYIYIYLSYRVSWCFMYLRWCWILKCNQYFYESITLEFIGMVWICFDVFEVKDWYFLFIDISFATGNRDVVKMKSSAI